MVLTLAKPNDFGISGNAVEYWAFIRALENLIVKKIAGQNTQLYFLLLYTLLKYKAGEQLPLSKKEIGHRTAGVLLQELYELSFEIASYYVEKLSTGPAIKVEDGEV